MSTLPTSERIAADWLRDGRRVVGATLVETIGSAPLDPGAQMLIDDRCRIEGSVTGGCVEGALVEEAQQILAGAAPRVVDLRDLRRAGDRGRPDVRRHRPRLRPREPRRCARRARRGRRGARLRPAGRRSRPCSTAQSAGTKMAILADRTVGGLGVTELLDHSVHRDARGQLDEGLSRIRRYGDEGALMGSELAVYIQAFSTRPRMVIFGAIDFSAEMAKLAERGRLRGHDLRRAPALRREPAVLGERRGGRRLARPLPRGPAAQPARRRPRLHPRPEVRRAGADRGARAPTPASSARSAAAAPRSDRVERLRERGLDEDALARIHAPCGLDVGARTPAETAISILAEVIAVRSGRAGESLRETEGPIHPQTAAVDPSG